MDERTAGETLLQFRNPVRGEDGRLYEARACGSPMPGGTWQGWIEFVPIGGGPPVRTSRETTQPNRADTEYWATGLTEVFLEGALVRALAGPVRLTEVEPEPSIFRGPAPSTIAVTSHTAGSILDPFSAYEKGEPLLRKQLSALSAWHLVNIVVDYDLSELDREALNRLPAADLINLIVRGVRAEIENRHHPA